MYLGGLTASQISTNVWAQATRSLTNAGYQAIQEQQNQSLAIGTQFGFAPAVGKYRLVTVSISQPAGGAGNANIEQFDGTTAVVLATAAPGNTGNLWLAISTHNVFIRINNTNNTNATNYRFSLIEVTI